MNTRSPAFAELARCAKAMMNTFNFEFINQNLNSSEQPPHHVLLFNSRELGMREGPAEGRVAEFSSPGRTSSCGARCEGYALPVSDGSERNRAGRGPRTEPGSIAEPAGPCATA